MITEILHCSLRLKNDKRKKNRRRRRRRRKETRQTTEWIVEQRLRERSNFKERERRKGWKTKCKGWNFLPPPPLSLFFSLLFFFFHATRCLKSQFRSVLDEFSRKIAFDECHYSVPPLTIQCDFSSPSSATFHPKRSLSRRLFLAHWSRARNQGSSHTLLRRLHFLKTSLIFPPPCTSLKSFSIGATTRLARPRCALSCWRNTWPAGTPLKLFIYTFNG